MLQQHKDYFGMFIMELGHSEDMYQWHIPYVYSECNEYPPTNYKMFSNTVNCRYNAVNFLPNPHNSHPIARP